MKLDEINFYEDRSEMNELLFGTCDTIYFDSTSQIFKIIYDSGFQVGITPDKLIDIL